MPVKWNSKELERLDNLDQLPEVQEEMLKGGERIAARARLMAPWRIASDRDNQGVRAHPPGAGARSIHAELAHDPIAGTHVRIGWDREFFYLWFSEAGTEHQPARPFLRAAASPYLDRPST